MQVYKTAMLSSIAIVVVVPITEVKMMDWSTAEDGINFEWHEKQGEYVELGERLYSVETAKRHGESGNERRCFNRCSWTGQGNCELV